MNTAIVSGGPAAGNVGVGFAVPINTIRELLPELRRWLNHARTYRRADRITPVTRDLAEPLGLEDTRGPSDGRTGCLPAASRVRAAVIYSLVQSCALVDVPAFDYLKDILLGVAIHPQRLIDQLTPKGWAASFRQSTAA